MKRGAPDILRACWSLLSNRLSKAIRSMRTNAIRTLARQTRQVRVSSLCSAHRGRCFTTIRRDVFGENRTSSHHCQPPSHSYTYRPISTESDRTATDNMTSSVPTSSDLLEFYRGLVAQGRLKWDDDQVRCVLKVCHAYMPINLTQKSF